MRSQSTCLRLEKYIREGNGENHKEHKDRKVLFLVFSAFFAVDSCRFSWFSSHASRVGMKAPTQKSATVDPGEREITFAQAINEALAEEMRRDSRVFIIGEDVADAGTPFKVLVGLVKEFGTKRVIDSPISEA